MEARIARAWYGDDVIEEEEDELEWLARKGLARFFLSNGMAIAGRGRSLGSKDLGGRAGGAGHYLACNRVGIG